MEVSIENVKEISLVTKRITMCSSPNDYTDLLRVSPGWISYQRVNVHTKNIVVEWSYKTKSYDYLHKWNNLVYSFCCELNCQSEKCERTDSSLFNVRVTFKNGKYIDVHGNSNLYDSNLVPQAEALFSMIPCGEECSDLIKPFVPRFYEEDLLRCKMTMLDVKRVNSIMFAEGGAQGAPGLVEITTEDMIRYSNAENSDISQIDALDYFNDLKLNIGSSTPFYKFRMNNQSWLYINLGAGNHLYLREDLFNKIGNEIFDIQAHVRYYKWYKFFHSEFLKD